METKIVKPNMTAEIVGLNTIYVNLWGANFVLAPRDAEQLAELLMEAVAAIPAHINPSLEERFLGYYPDGEPV